MNELNKHKKSDNIKWALTGIAFLLVFIMLIGMCLQLFGTGKQKPSEWFKKSETEQTTPDNGNENGTPKMSALSYSVPRSMAVTTAASAEASVSYPYSPYFEPHCVYSNYNATGVLSYFSAFRLNKTNYLYVRGACYKDFRTDEIAFDCNSYLSSSSMAPPEKMGCLVILKSGLFGSSTNYIVKSIECDFLSLSWVEYKDCFVSSAFSHMYLSNATITITVNTERAKEPVPLPADPVKEGYTFVGWYYDSDYTRAYDGELIYADTQLYAKFEINQFTVTFNSDGGSAVASQTVDWNTSATLSTPTRDGYAFKGWFLSDGMQYTNQVIKADTTLTAKWERNRFTVIFNSDGGSEVDNQTVMLNNAVTLVTPTKMGYNFVGWYMADGTEYENQPVTDDLTLTAHWDVIMCTVTFYVDGEVYETKTVEYGTSLVPIASELNLCVMTVYSASPEFTTESFAKNGVTADLSVTAEEVTGMEKVVNTVKNNKWQIIGGVVCGVALIAIIAVVCSSVKQKKY